MMKKLYENIILIVDDTPENIDILVELLDGFDKRVAINGKDALETAWEVCTPDLILLDIMMPEMDGYEVCKRLRADKRTEKVPVIFLTAKGTKDDIVQGFEVGGQDYITKPFDARELMERVKTQLELKNQREELKNMNVILEEKVKERTFQLQQAVENLDMANRELQGLDKAKNNFLSLISHELRTPLNGIVGVAALLNETLKADTELSEFAEMLQISVDRLDNFSSKALLITNLQTNYKLQKENCNVISCIKNVIDENLPIANNKGITFDFDCSIDELSMEAEKGLIKMAVASIINNAVKYSDPNGKIKIVLINDDNIKLQVSDNGRGFSEVAKRNLYKPFGLGEDHYDQNVGLSLMLTKHIMEVHNGNIEIENTEDGGAKVILSF